MAITENQLISDVKSGKISPVYLLTGEENYFIDVISDFFETSFIDESFRDFDQSVVYGRDVDVPTIVSMAKRYPMMSPYQLVLVKEAQDLTSSQEAWDNLAAYCKTPQPQTVLVLCYRHKKLDKRSKIYKAIAAAGVVYEHACLRDYEMSRWIAQYVNQRHYSITEKSAQVIADFVGNNLGKVVNELEKLFVVLPSGSVINDEVVERYVGISKDYNVFELQRALGTKNVEKCNKIVKHFAASPKDNPIQMVLPVLYTYFINLMCYIQNPADSKIPPYAVRDYEAAARCYTLPKLAHCIGYLYEADKKVKGIKNRNASDGEIYKELIFKITH